MVFSAGVYRASGHRDAVEHTILLRHHRFPNVRRPRDMSTRHICVVPQRLRLSPHSEREPLRPSACALVLVVYPSNHTDHQCAHPDPSMLLPCHHHSLETAAPHMALRVCGPLSL